MLSATTARATDACAPRLPTELAQGNCNPQRRQWLPQSHRVFALAPSTRWNRSSDKSRTTLRIRCPKYACSTRAHPGALQLPAGRSQRLRTHFRFVSGTQGNGTRKPGQAHRCIGPQAARMNRLRRDSCSSRLHSRDKGQRHCLRFSAFVSCDRTHPSTAFRPATPPRSGPEKNRRYLSREAERWPRGNVSWQSPMRR